MIKHNKIPKGETPSSDYVVTLNGECADIYQCRVSAIPFNTVWPGYQRPVEQTELASFMYFSMDSNDTVSVRVDVMREFKEAVIRPASSGVTPKIDGNSVVFTVEKTGQYVLEIDGHHHALHIFVNKSLDFDIDKKSKDVIYFGPGIHRPGKIELKSNQILYIDDGAVVHTSIASRGQSNIKILGRGILDNSEFIRENGDCAGINVPTPMQFFNCENITVDGIIIRDACSWTATAFNCVNVVFGNVKLIGMWRYNADGIDMVNCQNVIIRNCFLRTFDDGIVLKGIPPYDFMNVENVIVTKCVVWCDWGNALEIGAETCAEQYRNIVFSDCDVIHATHIALSIQNSGYAHVHDITYENIRVEYSKYCDEPIYQESSEMVYAPKTETHIPCLTVVQVRSYYADILCPGCTYGRNSDIHYENIQVIADEGLPVPVSVFCGVSEVSNTRGVYMKNLHINGKRHESLESGNIQVGSFAGDVKIK